MQKEITPIFIFSMPRSGSTLLQGIISSHPNVDTSAEPWICLPVCYIGREKGTISLYSNKSLSKAYNSIIDKITIEGINKAKQKFILDIYSQMSGQKTMFFLDKTPRYYLIIDELFKIFPKAKFIFLERDFEEIFVSINRTWHRNSFYGIHTNFLDIYTGAKLISNAKLKYSKKSHFIKYKDIILNYDKTIKDLCDYIDLEYKTEYFREYNASFVGELGDPINFAKNNKPMSTSLGKWDSYVDSLFYKKILLKTFLKTSKEYLDTDEIMYRVRNINNIKVKKIGITQFLNYTFSLFYSKILSRTHNHKHLDIFFKSGTKGHFS